MQPSGSERQPENANHAALEAAFGKAAPDHFAWQTRAPGVAERERELVERSFLPLGARVLDLGCGEGATLFHLGEPEGAYGVDLFPQKVEFARQQLPKCRFQAASVYELPFEDASFDHVIVRDVVHHLDEPARFVREARRVLAPRGRIDVVEPCRYNPLILLHGLLNRAERGELRSTFSFLTGLLERDFDVVLQQRFQPFPVHRIAFHPVLGRPALANNPAVRALVDGTERLAGVLVPRVFWAYLHVRGIVRPR